MKEASIQRERRIEEKRRDFRYPLEIPIIFSWAHGTPGLGAGFTRNVSSTGLFVTSAAKPSLKAPLKCQLLLPTAGNNAGNAIKVTGQVVRLSKDGEGRGFAIRARLYSSTKKVTTAVPHPSPC